MIADALTGVSRASWRDMVALGKPRLSLLVLSTTAVGLRLAPGHLPWGRALLTLLGSALVVGAANALNSYLERDVDALMDRTCQRPLPAQRLSASTALWISGVTALLAIGLLYKAANPLTALLSFTGFAVYAWVYTPMKRCSIWAVGVGAVPGAIPPLMGWTAVTNRLDIQGWALFGLLFLWQLPHFFSIAVYRQEDYVRAGLKALPAVWGIKKTVLWTVLSMAALVPVSLLPAWGGVIGWGYGMAAAWVGGVFVIGALRGLCISPVEQGAERWARGVFLGSIAYLVTVMACLVAGAG